MEAAASVPKWTVFTNHGHVLIYVAQHPDARIRDIAAGVGITERTALVVINDLEAAGYVERSKIGRRSHYHVHREARLHHPVLRGAIIGDILAAIPQVDARRDEPPRLVF